MSMYENLFCFFNLASNAAAPTNVMASPLSGQVGIRVSWTAPTLPTGLPITGYSIQYKIRGMSDSTYVIVTVGVGATQRVITNLQSSTIYRIRIATETGLGTGPYCCQTTPLYVTTSELEIQIYTNSIHLIVYVMQTSCVYIKK